MLTRHLFAVGGQPWLLKLHGDVRRPSTMVLTETEYEELTKSGAALHGIVQGLMLTSHLLFVGFSLTDSDFTALAHEVRLVRQKADAAGDGTSSWSGTALALNDKSISSEQFKEDVDTITMSGHEDVAAAARTLEVFLDRLAWRAATSGPLAAEYLLDPRYREGATAQDAKLRQALEDLVDGLGDAARHSSGWAALRDLLQRLGGASLTSG